MLSPVLRRTLPDNAVTRNLKDEVRREKTQQLMVRVLRAKLGRSAAVLVFEDVHWMDDSSWKLLVEVMAQVVMW